MTRPWFITLISAFLLLSSIAGAGALWSGSTEGLAFAEAYSGTYGDKSLAYVVVAVIFACACGIFLARRAARDIYAIWVGYGMIEGVAVAPRHFSPVAFGVYASIVAVLFLPPARDWFATRRSRLAS